MKDGPLDYLEKEGNIVDPEYQVFSIMRHGALMEMEGDGLDRIKSIAMEGLMHNRLVLCSACSGTSELHFMKTGSRFYKN